jgi:hypothetical protein
LECSTPASTCMDGEDLPPRNQLYRTLPSTPRRIWS